MRIIITFFLINFIQCHAISGLIWDRRAKNFVSIFSIYKFKTLQDKIHEEIKPFERHNFQGEGIQFLFYDAKNVFQFYDDSKVTGICGDLWTILSEYLNFTMILLKTDIRTMGVKTVSNNSYSGLLGIQQKNNNVIIPWMESYIPWLDVVDFTTPLWKTRHRLFIKSYSKYKTTWMLDLFSWHIWCLIIVFYILLSILSIFSHRVINQNSKSLCLISSVQDHLFYNFGALCNQGDVLYLSQKNLKIQSFCMSMFSWILITCFSSQLIIYVTQTVLVPPFEDLESLIKDTNYVILAEKYSIVYISFEQNYRPIYKHIKKLNRIQFYTSQRYMWNLACSNKNKYAILQHEKIKMDAHLTCTLKPIGTAYIKTWMAAGLPKKFIYKRTLDISLMKLHEFGIVNLLRSRWLKPTDVDLNANRYYSPIKLDQVSLLIGMFIFGLCTSIICVTIENYIYMQTLKEKSNKK